MLAIADLVLDLAPQIGDPNFQLFAFRLLMSFLVGAGWITLVTIAAERLGPSLGGFLAGVPATIVLSLVFVGLSEGPEAAVQATTIVPYSYSFSVIFVVVYAALADWGRVRALMAASIAWLFPSLFIILSVKPEFSTGISVWLVMLGSAWVFFSWRPYPPAEGAKVCYTRKEILLRASIAGSAIATSLLAARLGGPLWGGVAAGFPAVFFSTLLLVHGSRGPRFTRAMCRTLILSGMINVIGYAATARLAYSHFGLWGGTATAIAVSAVIVYFSYKLLNFRPAKILNLMNEKPIE